MCMLKNSYFMFLFKLHNQLAFHYKWIIIDRNFRNVKEMDKQILEIFENYPILLRSEIFYISNSEKNNNLLIKQGDY